MSFKNFLILLLFWIPALLTEAQNITTIDSLKNVLSQTKDDKEKVYLLHKLANNLIDSDVNQARVYGEESYTLASQAGYKTGELKSCLLLARIFYFMSDLKNAMNYAIQAKNLAEDLGLDKELALSHDAIGLIFYDIGNQAKSSENFFASLKIYEKLKDKNGIGATFCRIGTLYLDQKDYDKAEEYYSNSIRLAREIDSQEGIASNLNNLAKVYGEKQDFGKALQTYEEALRINIRTGNSYLEASNYLNIADVYEKIKEYPAAIEKIEQALKIFRKLGNNLRIAKCEILLSKIYLETGRPDQGRLYAQNALKAGNEGGYKEITAAAAGVLNRIYLSQKDSAAAFRYFILEKDFQDSLFLDKKQKTLSALELQYQFEKNEQSQKIARQRKNITILIISGCLFFSLIIMVLILKQLRLKAKKLQLEKAGFERELEFKNKEMVLNVMSLMKKNEMLADLSEKLIRIEKEETLSKSKETIKKVARELQKSQEEEIWKEFSYRFKEVHGEFYNNLLQKFPTLSPNELKLCAFLRLNMSSKDIAELTGQRVSSLETARYRLRQKLGIANSDINLITFLSTL
jgi:tetratricopeptide (TPR) repeat protein